MGRPSAAPSVDSSSESACVAALGERDGKLYWSVYRRWESLKVFLDFYSALISPSDGLALWNGLFGGAGQHVKRALRDDLIMQACCLTDKHRASASITKFSKDFMCADLEDFKERAVNDCEPLRKLRNKALAHRDWEVELGDEQLRGVVFGEINAAVDAVHAFVSQASLEHFNSSIANAVAGGYSDLVPLIHARPFTIAPDDKIE